MWYLLRFLKKLGTLILLVNVSVFLKLVRFERIHMSFKNNFKYILKTFLPINDLNRYIMNELEESNSNLKLMMYRAIFYLSSSYNLKKFDYHIADFSIV